jgi:hypothetical protein
MAGLNGARNGERRMGAAPDRGARLGAPNGGAGGKGTTSGSNKDPRLIDATSQTLNAVNQKPLTDVQKAVIQDRIFNKQNETGLDIAQTILGALPTNLPMGAAMKMGRKMNEMVDDDALAHPEKYDTIPGSIGGVRSVMGPLNANRALPGPSAKTTEASSDESARKKKQALPTLLGAPASPLGTLSNPQVIT